MGKVRFLNSVRVRFVIILVLLIFFAMQMIGVYFVKKLEAELITNFQTSIEERISLLNYTVKTEMTKPRNEGDEPLKEVLDTALSDYDTGDFEEVMVIDRNGTILATSDEGNKDSVGEKSNDIDVQRALTSGISDPRELIDEETRNRLWVFAEPIIDDGETVGCLYVSSRIEKVYQQVDDINTILKTGTLISMAITAVVALFIAQMITKPISEMHKQAIAMSKGHYNRSVRVFGNDEIGQLATTFNSLSRKLQDAQSTTEAEKRKLASILTNMSDGVIATDRKGRVILINEPALKMLDFQSEDDVLSKSLTEVLDIESEFPFKMLLERKESLILDYSEKEEKYFLKAYFSAIQRETGFVNGLITVLHDITEQEKIEDERKEFVANVSHELRTPLTTMRSYLEALSDGAIKNEKLADKFLTVVQNETERMIRMVNDLLNLSKMEFGTSSLSLDWTEFGNFFNKIIDRFEMSAERNITLSREIPSIPVYVEIDRDKIIQVIDNIISNALKYSPDGGKISFKLQIVESNIEISIRDQGMGMPKGNVEKIFKRFYRVDKARSRQLGGTGLGLAIAKEIINAHNGDIFARSIEGVGTTIIFTLPCDSNTEDEWE